MLRAIFYHDVYLNARTSVFALKLWVTCQFCLHFVHCSGEYSLLNIDNSSVILKITEYKIQAIYQSYLVQVNIDTLLIMFIPKKNQQ